MDSMILIAGGILMGLGETREDRLASVAAIARVAGECGQVVILDGMRADPFVGTSGQ